MWSTLSQWFGLIQDEDDDDHPSSDKAAGTGDRDESMFVCPEREWREFDGTVTSLHSSYGLIDNEVFFTHDVVSNGVMPKVGDRIHVKASRKHKVGGWKAEYICPVINTNSWDDDADDSDEFDDGVDEEEETEFKERSEESKARLERARRLQEKRATEAAALDELMADKMGISITKPVDFGQMEIGKTKSLKLEIRNSGKMSQTLFGLIFKTPSSSSQFELSPLRLLSIDLKQSSRKAQETLPMTLEPQKVAIVTVYCNARYLGLDHQVVVFEFEGFSIGRKIQVAVLDMAQFDLQPVLPYQKSQAVGRYQQTKEAWIVPGQKPVWQRPGVKLPKRLPQFPVPESLRRCLLEQRDVTKILPILNKPLSPENYAARFSATLFLEELQQDIEIREFDLDNVNLRVHGEFLALNVPGLAEGRPSLLIGDRVVLSEPDDSVVAPSYEGIIHEVLKDEVLLKFVAEFHSCYEGKEYNVRFMFRRTNFKRCHTAVEFVSRLKNCILFPKNLEAKLPQNLPSSNHSQNAKALVVKAAPVSGRRHCPARPHPKELYAGHTFFNEMLNSRQRSAVFRVLQGQSRPMPYIIFGPPGTGKTVTVVECILQILFHLPNSCILTCTPSNSAADLLAERLHQSGLVHASDMVRLNAFQRGQESIVESVKPYCVELDDPDAVRTKRIVVCTCSTAGMFYTMERTLCVFTHVFVDEAGQATEPECMVPVGLVAANDGQIVLAGDPLQLGPVLRSNLAKDYGLQMSYLERLSRLPLYTRDTSKFVNHGSYDPLLVTKLVENYRSHPALLNLSSETFYDKELVISADKYLVECLCSWEHLPNKNSFPLLFHGIRGEDLREGNSPSWFNPQEAIQVVRYLQSIVHNDSYRLTYDDVGIITPYRKQVEKIRLLIDRLGMEKVKVGSVEEFQGQERLVMIISTVRSSESLVGLDLHYTLGFLSNPKRFNVAITRAHALLIVIGNPHVLSQDFYWSKLLQYCVVNGAYVGCDLPEIESLAARTQENDHHIDSSSLTDEAISSAQITANVFAEGDSMLLLPEDLVISNGKAQESGILAEANVSFSKSPDTIAMGYTVPRMHGSEVSHDNSASVIADVTSSADSFRIDDQREGMASCLKNTDPYLSTIGIVAVDSHHAITNTLADNQTLTPSNDYLPERFRGARDAERLNDIPAIFPCVSSKTSGFRNLNTNDCAVALQDGHKVIISVHDSDIITMNVDAGDVVSCNDSNATDTGNTVKDADLLPGDGVWNVAENENRFSDGKAVNRQETEIVSFTDQRMFFESISSPAVEGFKTSSASSSTGKGIRFPEEQLGGTGECPPAGNHNNTEETIKNALNSKLIVDYDRFSGVGADQNGTLLSEDTCIPSPFVNCSEIEIEPIEHPRFSSGSDSIKMSLASQSDRNPFATDLLAANHSEDSSLHDDSGFNHSITAEPELNENKKDSSILLEFFDTGSLMSDMSLHVDFNIDDLMSNRLTSSGLPFEYPDKVNQADISPAVDADSISDSDEKVSKLNDQRSSILKSEMFQTAAKVDEVSSSPAVNAGRIFSSDGKVSKLNDQNLSDSEPEELEVGRRRNRGAMVPHRSDKPVIETELIKNMTSCKLLENAVESRNRFEDCAEDSGKKSKGSDGADQMDCSTFLCHCVRKSFTSNGKTKHCCISSSSDARGKDGTREQHQSKDATVADVTATFDSGEGHGRVSKDDPERDVVSSKPRIAVAKLTPLANLNDKADISQRTRENVADGHVLKNGSPTNLKRRNSFEKETGGHRSAHVERRHGRGGRSGKQFHHGLQMDDKLCFPFPDSSSGLHESPGRVLGKLENADGTSESRIVSEASLQRRQEVELSTMFAVKRAETTAQDAIPHSSRARKKETDHRNKFSDDSSSVSQTENLKTELAKKIVRQMEYYFGDFNLMRDAFLKDHISRDPDGWVDLSVIVTFNRMKSLTADFNVICDALRKSTSGIVEVSEDNTRVRRSTLKPLNTDEESWLKDLKSRSAVIKNYPSSETIDNMQTFVETSFGGVAHIERGICKQSHHRGQGGGRSGVEMVDLVIFLSQEGLLNCAKRRFTTLKRMGLIALFGDDITSNCVDYFYKRRVLGIPKHILPLVQEGSDRPARNRAHHGSSFRLQKPTGNETSENSASCQDRLSGSPDLDMSYSSSAGDGKVSATSTKDQDLQQSFLESATVDGRSGRQQWHRASWRQAPRNNVSRRSSDHPSFDRPSNENLTFSDQPKYSRYQRRPWRNCSDVVEDGQNIDRILSGVDNLSFSKQEPASSERRSSDPVCSASLESNPHTENKKTAQSPISKQDDAISKESMKSSPDLNPTTSDLQEIKPDNTQPTVTHMSREVSCFVSDSKSPECFVVPEPRPLSVKATCFVPRFKTPAVIPSCEPHIVEQCVDIPIPVADQMPHKGPTVTYSPRSIPEMNLDFLVRDADYDEDTKLAVLVQSVHEPVSYYNTAFNDSPEDQTVEESYTYKFLDQQDDDIIIESSCEEILEDDSNDEGQGGWD